MLSMLFAVVSGLLTGGFFGWFFKVGSTQKNPMGFFGQ
jgi:hypothetical protein